jgi:hypothetical protein
MEQEDDKVLITYSSLYIEALGPREFANSPVASVCVADFLLAPEHDIQNLLHERARMFPNLKGFDLQFR